jgi:hypothetical protein
MCRRFHAYNIGHLSSRAAVPLFTPCTPTACIKLLESTGVEIAGANAVVLGRSDIVGSPVASMLRNKDATVTQCHSKTKNVPDLVRRTAFLSIRPLIHSHSRSKTRISLLRLSAKRNMCRGLGSNLVRLLLTLASTMFLVRYFSPAPASFISHLSRCLKEIGPAPCWRCTLCISLRGRVIYYPCAWRSWSDDCGDAHVQHPQVRRTALGKNAQLESPTATIEYLAKGI